MPSLAKLKAHLRRIEARTYDTLIQALGTLCDLFSPIMLELLQSRRICVILNARCSNRTDFRNQPQHAATSV